jgi:alkylation response protein AidB-like acyl-CoA dehydrogenase
MSASADKSLQIAAGDLELAEAALNAAAELVRTHEAAREIVADNKVSQKDPHLSLRFGQLRARLHAAHGLLSRAVRLHEHARSTQSENTLANIVALQAQAFARDVTLEINNELTTFGGISIPDWSSRGSPGPSLDEPNHLVYERIGRYYLQAELSASNDVFSSERPS